MTNFFSAAVRSFQENLDRIETEGRKDSPDWHLASGLLQLAQGLHQAREEEEELRRSFARSWGPQSRAMRQQTANGWRGDADGKEEDFGTMHRKFSP